MNPMPFVLGLMVALLVIALVGLYLDLKDRS